MKWTRRIVQDDHFPVDERAYKVEVARTLKEAVARLRSGGDWSEALQRALRSKENNLLTPWLTTRPGSFGRRVAAEPDAFRPALAVLWADDDSHGAERIAAFCALLPDIDLKAGNLASLGAFLLGGLDVERWPSYRYEAMKMAFRLTGFPTPATSTAAGYYEHALAFFDAMKAEARHGTSPSITDSTPRVPWVICTAGTRAEYASLTRTGMRSRRSPAYTRRSGKTARVVVGDRHRSSRLPRTQIAT